MMSYFNHRPQIYFIFMPFQGKCRKLWSDFISRLKGAYHNL